MRALFVDGYNCPFPIGVTILGSEKSPQCGKRPLHLLQPSPGATTALGILVALALLALSLSG